MPSDETLAGIPPQGPDEDIPLQVGDYLIENKLGEGGGGRVFKARHRVIGRVAAIKLMSPLHAQSQDMVRRFVQEAQAVNQIRHPNLVDVFDFGVTPEGLPYLCMEYLEGDTLRSLVAKRGRLSVHELLEYLEPVCQALHAAHQAGFIHRDVKASNVMVARASGGWRTKLLDFGIAKYIHADPTQPAMTRAGTRMGTPSAMAPEQIRGQAVDARTDVYGLGILIFDVLTGERPFLSTTSTMSDQEEAHLHAPPPVPSHKTPVAPAVDAVVLRCLEKDPRKRFPTALAVFEALKGAVTPTSATKATGAPRKALGIHFEVRSVDNEELNDHSQDDLERSLLDAAAQFRNAGFVVVSETANSLLVVWWPRGQEDFWVGMPEWTTAITTVRSTVSGLESRLKSMPSPMNLRASAHVDEVLVRDKDAGVEAAGGPLMKLRSWVLRDAREGLWGTEAAAEAWGLETGAPAGHVRLT